MVQCTNFVYKKKKNSAQYLADNLTTNSKNLTDYKKYPYEIIVYTLKKIIKKIATTPFQVILISPHHVKHENKSTYDSGFFFDN